MAATQAGAKKIARALITAGADVNARDKVHDMPFLLAAAHGYILILKAYLSHGANLENTNRNGGSALVTASGRGHIEPVHLLLETGMNVDHVNTHGWTPLIEAIIHGDGSEHFVEIARMLIDAGAEVNLPDADGKSPFRLAREREFHGMVNLLVTATV